jgi:hypothetical protein
MSLFKQGLLDMDETGVGNPMEPGNWSINTYIVPCRWVSRDFNRNQWFDFNFLAGVRLNVAEHDAKTSHAYIQPQIQKLDLKSK